MDPTEQPNAGYHLPSMPPPSYPPLNGSAPFAMGPTPPYAQAYGQPFPQTFMGPMQMHHAAHPVAHGQPFHQHVLNPAAQTFIHSGQAGPNIASPGYFLPAAPPAPEDIPQQKTFKELLEEPMPHCDSEYCGGFCRDLADALPKINPQPTVKLPKAGGKKARTKWQPRKFALFYLPLTVRKNIYRNAMFPFQPKGIRKAFQLNMDLKALFTLGNVNGLLESNKVVRLEFLQVWIEQADLQLYQHEVRLLNGILRPLGILRSGLEAWNFRRLYFFAEINSVIAVRCCLDFETPALFIDLGGPGKGAVFVSVYEYSAHSNPDIVASSTASATMKNTVSAAKQLGSFMQPIFNDLVRQMEGTKLGVEDIKKVANRFFAVARPAFYNVDVEEIKNKWANFIDPADRLLYALDEEWRPLINPPTFTG